MKVILKGLFLVWLCLFLLYTSSNLWSFDLIQITNTPDVNEENHSIAVKGKSIYLTWQATGAIYFAKSGNGGLNWSTPIEIGKGLQPSIAVGDNDIVYLAWWQRTWVGSNYIDTVFTIYSKDDGENFPKSHIKVVDRGEVPVVKIDTKGQIHIVWFRYYLDVKEPPAPYNTYVIYACAPHPDSTFGIYVKVDSVNYGWRHSMDLVLDYEAQNIYVAWSKPAPHYILVQMSASRNGGTSFEDVYSGLPHGEYNPCLAFYSNDDIYIAWEHDGYGWYDVYFRKYEDRALKAGLIIRLNDLPVLRGPLSEIFQPTIAVDSKNTVYAVWIYPRCGYKDSTDIYFDKSDYNGQIFGTDILIDVSLEPSKKRNPSIFVSNSDTIGIVWEDNRDGDYDIYLTYVSTLVPSWAHAPFNKITDDIVANDGGTSWSSNWVDYDNDGFLDLFVANDRKNFLYHNNKDGTFEKITIGYIVNDDSRSRSSSWGDYDNNGYFDLFVANYNQNNLLYQNNGDGNFTKIKEGDIVNDGGKSMGCSWADYDNDGYLDLFVANTDNENNFLYKNNGDCTFTKITTSDIVNSGGTSWGVAWGDYDNDGYLDLFVANYWYENNFLYKNNGDGTFTKVTNSVIVNDEDNSWSGSWGDYDNDGYLDLFVASYKSNSLYHNKQDGTFEKIKICGDIFNYGALSTGSAWGDYDNDGDLDLFVPNDINSNNFLFMNTGYGTFKKIMSGISVNDEGRSGGSSFGDYDNDGDLDLVVINSGDNFLYQNKGNDNNWINIKCVGTKSNYAAIGAKVKVKANINGVEVWQMNEISGQTGGGGSSQNSLNVEFGLGNAAIIDSILLIWPSGIRQVLTNITPNQIITIQEDTKGYDISGNISYYSNSLPVNEAIVLLTGSLNLEDATDTNGNYQFLQIPSGDYTSMPKKEEHKPKDFITPYDAALILQYAVGLIKFTPYQKIASDVSGNGEITAFDASLILRYFVGFIDSFSVMPDKSHFWTFVPTDFHIDTLNWSIAPDSLRYEPIDSDTLNQDFVGIIYGDASGNWTGSTDRGASVIAEISIGNIQRNNDGSWLIPLEMVFSDEAYSGSFKVLVSNPDLKFASSSNDNSLSDNMLFTSNAFPGGINLAFASAQPLNEQVVKINISLEEIKPVMPSVADFEFVDVVVDDKSATVTVVENQSSKQISVDWHLSQNYPNPFNAETSISYQFPMHSHVTIEIFNLMGQRVCTIVNEDKSPGIYKTIWNGKDDQGRSVGSGIYIYRMDAGEFTAMKKMVLVQ